MLSEQFPKFGCLLLWPEAGTDWIHPDDAKILSSLVPSERIWRKYAFSEPYYFMNYGDIHVRIRPTLWTELASDQLVDNSFEVGEAVEIRTRFGKNAPAIGRVVEKKFRKHLGTIEYTVRSRNYEIPRRFHAADLVSLESKTTISESTFSHPAPRMIEPESRD